MIDFKQITNKIVIESNINITKYTLYNVYDDLGILKLRLANSNHLAGNTYKATHISLNDCLIGENVILTSICKLSNSLLTGFPVVDNGDIYLGEDGLITNTQVTDSLDLYQVIGFQSNDYTEITIHDSKTNIDGVYNGYEIYENIASGTAGTITIPSSAEILLDKYPDAGDCLIVKTDTNGKPMDEPAKDSSENIIQGTLNISGNYTLSATPSSYPVSIVFQIKLPIKYFSIIEDRFVNRTELYRASEIEYDNTTSSLTSTQVQSAIDEVNNKIDSDRGVTKEPTGIKSEGDDYNQDIDVFYDNDPLSATYKCIKLTGIFKAYCRGKLCLDVDGEWISDPSPNVVGQNQYMLTYNDDELFLWRTPDNFKFSDIIIAYTYYRDNGDFVFAIREVHGLMQWQVHNKIHNTMGSTLISGGDLSDFTLNNTTNKRPNVSSTVIEDEDLRTLNPAFTSKNYTVAWLDDQRATSITDLNDIVQLSENNFPLVNTFDGTNWVLTELPNNNSMSVWVYAKPSTSDTQSQKYRYVFLTGQGFSSSNTAEEGKSIRDLDLKDLTIILTEVVFIGQIVIRRQDTNWVFQSVTKLTGSRNLQIGMPTGNYLSIVESDATLNGSGTLIEPLSVNFDIIKPSADSTTAIQITKADGVTPITTFDTENDLQVSDAWFLSKKHGIAVLDFPSFGGIRSRGTVDVPIAVGSFDYLNLISGNGYNGTDYTSVNPVGIGLRVGGETWTETSTPTEIFFGTTPSGSTTRLERMVISRDGNVGIGTNNPAEILDIRSSSDAVVNIVAGTAGVKCNANIYMQGSNASNSNVGAGVIGVENPGISTNGDMYFQTRLGGTLTEKMRITSNGNVGIGTADPESSLVVVTGDTRNVNFDRYEGSAASAYVVCRKARGNQASPTGILNNDFMGVFGARGHNGTGFTTSTGTYLLFQATENWTATSNGCSASIFTIANGTTSGERRLLIDNNGALAIPNVYTSTTAASNVYVASGGRITRATSSLRYKTDIEDMSADYADNLYKMRPVWYRSTCEIDNKDWSWWGFIAEELAEIDPRLVDWGYWEEDYEDAVIQESKEAVLDEEGNIIEEVIEEKKERQLKEDAVKTPVGVMYDRITVLLTKEVQEHKNTIDKQQELIDKQQAIIDSLLQRVEALEMANNYIR